MMHVLYDRATSAKEQLARNEGVREAGRRVRGAWREIRGETPLAVQAAVRRSRLRRLGLILIGAALAYFFDPDRGRTRRTRTFDQVGAALRSSGRRAGRAGRRVSSRTAGMVEKARYERHDYEAPNDATLAHKVESELFGRPEVPKGRINVNAEQGVVVLRGQVETTEQIDQIEMAARRIEGVTEVENLLHVAGTAAPNKRRATSA
ncbi:MAG: BON domain-containing protein [Acidimicrobiia bacterium]